MMLLNEKMKGLLTILKNACSIMAITTNTNCINSPSIIKNQTLGIVPNLNATCKNTYQNTYGDNVAIISTFLLSIIWLLVHT